MSGRFTKVGLVRMLDFALRQSTVHWEAKDGFVLCSGTASATLGEDGEHFVVHVEFMEPKIGLAHRLVIFNPNGIGAWFEHIFVAPWVVEPTQVVAFHFDVPWNTPELEIRL